MSKLVVIVKNYKDMRKLLGERVDNRTLLEKTFTEYLTQRFKERKESWRLGPCRKDCHMLRSGHFIRDGDKYALYSQKAHRELDADSVDWLEMGRKTVEVTITYEGCKFVLYRDRSDKLGEFDTIDRAVESGISHIHKEVTSLFG